ncbi:MAG: hypothetical protein E7048_00735 [Lentisphaerae bacterium]|nr:hypothetical protein [Lentisphaerota bacterium]
MNPPLLMWDIDDVLNDLIGLCTVTTAQKLCPGIKPEDIKSNPPLREYGCSREEYLQLLDNCRAQYLYSQPPRREVMAFFQEWGNCFRSVTLSSAPMTTAPRSAEWVLRHFGAWIQSTLFVPSPRKTVTVRSCCFASKADAVLALDGILIDDMPVNVEKVREAGGKAFCFPAPWNENRNISINDFFSNLIKELELSKWKK